MALSSRKDRGRRAKERKAAAAAASTAVMPEADEIDNAAGEPSANNNDIDGTSEADEASDAGAIVKNKPLTKRQVQKKCIYHKHRRTVVEEQNKYLKKAVTSAREADEANHNFVKQNDKRKTNKSRNIAAGNCKRLLIGQGLGKV